MYTIHRAPDLPAASLLQSMDYLYAGDVPGMGHDHVVIRATLSLDTFTTEATYWKAPVPLPVQNLTPLDDDTADMTYPNPS